MGKRNPAGRTSFWTRPFLNHEIEELEGRLRRGEMTKAELVHARKTESVFYAELECLPFQSVQEGTGLSSFLYIMEIDVVAEGGCAQGYLFCKPMSFEEMEQKMSCKSNLVFDNKL